MKKIIQSILLAASASSGILLAQVENRLKETARGFPGNITTNYNNQVTGCRLQVAGSNQETGCREQLTDTNQVTGCRLQVAGTNQTTENQICQQAEPTTSYELPTANCDNSSQDLSCHLMMDPEELKNIEEGVEGLRARRKKTQPRALVEATAAIHAHAESTSSSATILGKRDREALQVLLSTKEDDRETRDMIRLDNDTERAMEEFRQAAQRRAEEKKKEDDSCDWVGRLLQRKAFCETKASRAQEAGKVILEAGYREAAGILEHAVEQYQQTALTYAEGRESEGVSLKQIQEYSTRQVCYLIKAAEKKEKIKLEKGLISKNNDNGIPLNTIGIDKNLNQEACFNIKEMDDSTKSKTLFTRCEKWLKETGSTTKHTQLLSDYVMDVVQRGVDHKLVSAFEEYRDHVIEAHEAEDDSQAIAWLQVAEEMQQAMEESIKAAEAGENKNYKLWNAWSNTAQATEKLAECRGKYIQASISSPIPEITNGWKKIVEESQAVVDSYKKIIEVFDSEKSLYCENFPNEDSLGERDRIGKHYIEQACSIEYKYVEKTADSMKENLRKLIEAMTSFEKSFSDLTQSKSLILWEKALEQYQISRELDVKAIEKGLKEDRKELALFRGVFYKETLPYKDKMPKFSK